jgi:hypothetical protein
MKCNHQSPTDSGPSGVGTIARAEKLIQSIPVNDFGQLDQPMAGIDDAAKLNPEQILLPIVVRRFLWFHALKNRKVLDGCCRKTCNSDSTFRGQLLINSTRICVFQARLRYHKPIVHQILTRAPNACASAQQPEE